MAELVNEKELIQGLCQGDPAIQQKFYSAYIDPLTQWLCHKGVRCQHDMEEILHDTYHRAFKGIGKFQGRSSLKTWLFTLASRAKVDYYRRDFNGSIQTPLEISDINENLPPSKGQYRAKKADSETEGLETRTPIADTTSPELEGMITAERREKVIEVLNQLTEDHRDILFLRWINDHSVKETADILGKSEGAVKMMTGRAMEAFRSNIDKSAYFNSNTVPSETGDIS
jgi:RNA polymerase sigma-70 factor (ECF subfamily)